LRITYNPDQCNGCWQCYEVCPTGRWSPDHESRRARFSDPDQCVACGACVLQCLKKAIQLTTGTHPIPEV
jgi:NAD-dependent dihydropyrimidine dehydrogenase PreA subunit